MTGTFGTTVGPWHWVENAMSNGKPNKSEYCAYGEPALVSGEQMICWFGDSEQYYPTSGIEPSNADKRAIAQVPAMLALVEAASSRFTPHNQLVEMARKIAAELEKE